MGTLKTRLERLEAQQVPAEPLRRTCGCAVRVIDYRVAAAPLTTPSPQRDALLARANTDRCATCGGHLYGGGLSIAPIDWGVPVLTDSYDERTAWPR